MLASIQLVLAVSFASSIALSRSVSVIAVSTLAFPSQSACETKRATNPSIRRGDAAIVDEWHLPDGSFIHAEVVRDGTLEVERCPCNGRAAPASVRVRVLRAKAG